MSYRRIMIGLGCKGLGDILCAVPAIKMLHKSYNQKITVLTYSPELFKNFPYVEVEEIINGQYPEIKEDELFMETFEIHKFIHARTDLTQLHALACGFQLKPDEMDVEFFADEYIPLDLPKNYVVIHPVMNWPSRTWPEKKWQELVDKLNDKNIPVIAIGKTSDEFGTFHIEKPTFNINIKNGVNLINKLDIHQAWHILNMSDAVVTCNSGILILAGSTDTNIIEIGSSFEPFFRSPHRKGSQTYKSSCIGGECKIFCATNMKYNVGHNGNHKIMGPVPFCLERGESIGDQSEPDDVNIYKCHPSVDAVYEKVIEKCKIIERIPEVNLLTQNKGKIYV